MEWGGSVFLYGCWDINNLTASDVSKKMVIVHQKFKWKGRSTINFVKEDATKLSFASNMYDGVIFGFNGLMQIPASRKQKKSNE